MLNKNQSKKRNYFKYTFVIPILISFVFLFQIKVVAQEKNTAALQTLKTNDANNQLKIELEAQITEKSTDLDLERVINLFKNQLEVEVKIKKVKRNSQNEITAIKVTATDGKSYKTVHEINQKKPILPFTIKVVKDKDNKIEVFILSDAHLIDSKKTLSYSKDKDNEFHTINSMKINDKELLVVINDKIQIKGNTVNIPTDEEINTQKTLNSKEGIEKYGAIGENGAYEITTKKLKKNQSQISNSKPTPLFVVNGKIKNTDFNINDINPNSISTLNVLKGKTAIEKYGKDATNGVLEITTKDENLEAPTTSVAAKKSKLFSLTQKKLITDSLSVNRNAKLKTDQRDLNLEKIDPTQLNNKRTSKTTSKIKHVKVISNNTSIEEAEIYIDNVKSSKAELDKISPNSIEKMDVIKSDDGKKIIKITTRKQ